MLLALWLAITWLLYGIRKDSTGTYENVGNDKFNNLSCPYVCAVGDSIMMNIFETKLPVNSIGELHARCAATKYLIDECWNENKYGIDCLPQNKGLREQTIHFWDNYCANNKTEVNSCLGQWSRQNNQCSKEYINLVGHLVDQQKIKIMEANQVPVCCDFLKFLECAKKNVTKSCSTEVEQVVYRFFFKLSDQKALDTCLELQSTVSFKSRCV